MSGGVDCCTGLEVVGGWMGSCGWRWEQLRSAGRPAFAQGSCCALLMYVAPDVELRRPVTGMAMLLVPAKAL